VRDAREQLGRHRVALVGDEQVGMVDRVEPHLMREAIRQTQAHSQAPSAAITGSAWSTEESRADPLPPAQSPVIRRSSGGHQEESRTDPFTSRAWKVSLSRGRETRHRSDCATDPGFVKSVASSQRAHASTCESVSRRAITSSEVIRGHQRPSEAISVPARASQCAPSPSRESTGTSQRAHAAGRASRAPHPRDRKRTWREIARDRGRRGRRLTKLMKLTGLMKLMKPTARPMKGWRLSRPRREMREMPQPRPPCPQLQPAPRLPLPSALPASRGASAAPRLRCDDDGGAAESRSGRAALAVLGTARARRQTRR